MDFIGNLLNQMSSAFNQETAIPKKEEISMDETLKWRALKNNQFASRTRGGGGGAAATSGSPRSASSIGRRSRVANGGQQQQQGQDNNSNDSTGDGALLTLEEEEEEEDAKSAAIGGGTGDIPEEDIEIEIAKDISGEELQEALGLSQLVEVEEQQDVVELARSMEEGEAAEEVQLTMDQPEKDRPKVKGESPPTVEKQEPNEEEETVEERKVSSEDDRKMEGKQEPVGKAKGGSDSSSSTSKRDDDVVEENRVSTENTVATVTRDDRVDGVRTSGETPPTVTAQADDDLPGEVGIESQTTVADSIEKGDAAVEMPTQGMEIEDIATGIDDDDDDDVVIITTDEMTDVVELAETSKEEDDDDDDEAMEVEEEKEDDKQPQQQPPADKVDETREVEKQEEASSVENVAEEAEEKYHPKEEAEKKEEEGGKEEIKFAPSGDDEAVGGNKEILDTKEKTNVVDASSPRVRDSTEGKEKRKEARKEVSLKHDESEMEVDKKETTETDDGQALEDGKSVGRTTRSKKAATNTVAAVVTPASPSTPNTSQRRSQRFQAAKDPAASTLVRGKSADGKANGESTVDTIAVKEEDAQQGKKRVSEGSKTATIATPPPAKGQATKPAGGGGGTPSVVERRLSVKSDRSLRSRQQSATGGQPTVAPPSTTVSTRRSSETVKTSIEEATSEGLDTVAADRLNRRSRKRLSQEPALETAAAPSQREKSAPKEEEKEEQQTSKEEHSDFRLDPGENDSGGKQQEQQQPAPADQRPRRPQSVQPIPTSAQRRGRKRKPANPAEPSPPSAATTGSAATPSPEKPPPYKRAARVSRDGSDGILASALARRDKVDSQGRLSRPIKLSAKMLANEELRYGFEQHNNGRIFIGSDSHAADEPSGDRERDRDRDHHRALESVPPPGSADKSRKQQQGRQQQQQQQQQQQDTQGGESSQHNQKANLPPANSAISSSSEDVMVVSVTFPNAKGGGPAAAGKGKLYQAGKKQQQQEASSSSSERPRGGLQKPAPAGGHPSKRLQARPATLCPDVQTFLQEIRASRLGTSHRSPEENRKLNRRQTKRLAKLKEKHLLALGLQRKGAAVQQQQARNNGLASSMVVVPSEMRKSPAAAAAEEPVSEPEEPEEPEEESESSGSEVDFVPRRKIGTVGKPSVTLRLRKPETLLENAAAPKPQQQQQPPQRNQQPPLVTVPSALVRGASHGNGKLPVPLRRQQQQQQQGNGRMPPVAASSKRPSAGVPNAQPGQRSSLTQAQAAAALRKDRETEQLQRSLERFGCELTVIPNSSSSSSTTPPASSSDGRSSTSSTSGSRKRPKDPRSLVRGNHHPPVASSSSPAVLGTTSPSLQIVLEKPPTAAPDVVVPTPSAPPSSSSVDRAPPPLLCLCRQPADLYVANTVGNGYCTAVDDIDGQMIGCCNELTDEHVLMLRPSPTVSFQLLCNLHRKRLEDHSCCAMCGYYCTQGNFGMCKNAHLFHPACAVKYILSSASYDSARRTAAPGNDPTATPMLVLQCPHCGQECPTGEIQVTVQLTTPPVLLPSRKNIVKPARMTIGKGKGTTNVQHVFRANVESFVPSSVRKMFATGGGADNHVFSGPANGHGRKGGSPAVASAGTGASKTKSPFTTKNFFEAIQQNDVDRISEIILSGFDIETRFRNFHDGTCLHLVSNFGSIGMAYLIICRAQSVDFLNILDRELRTALMCAVLGAKMDIIKLLLECGADVTVRGPDGMTVLHLAAKLGHHEAVRMILEWARKRLTARDLVGFVNGVDHGPYTALVWAAENRHKETIQLLLAAGADVNICDKENNTSLHWAAMAGCSDSMDLLLKKGCDPNVQNVNGDTPLHLACRHGNVNICVMLLSTGASLNVRNTSNELPQDMLRNPNSECAAIIAVNVKMSSLGRNAKETRILCSDISNGREYYPVQVVHTTGPNDRQQPMPQFKYIQKSVQIECRIDTNFCERIVCSCKDSCTSGVDACGCSSRTWYTEDGRLVADFDFLDPPTIVECGDLCDCNQLLCRNRVVQRGLRVPLQLFYSPDKAWGVRTLVPIPKGTFLVEYVGELLTDELANQRPDDTYFFDLNSGFCIDANAYGNVSRFFNHSCDPNVSPVSVYYEHQDKRFPKVAMFACRDIRAQEEICFNYGEKFWMVKNRTLSCLCNANVCRYRTVQQGHLHNSA